MPRGKLIDKALHAQCAKLGIDYKTIRDRVYKLGWTRKRALSTPIGAKPTDATIKDKALYDVCQERGINYRLVRDRVYRLGWDVERAIEEPKREAR